MPDFDTQIFRQNPWWTDPRSIANDPHLVAFETSASRWDPPALDAIPREPGNTHSLRGPRQVGKTTTVKRIIAQLVQRVEPRVLYLSCDLLASYQDLVAIIERAKQLHPRPDGPWHIFLDEVSSVAEWQRAIKWGWDQGLTRGDLVVLTGSSARDVRSGVERLPGRRGDGADFLQLPMSFRDFCVYVKRLALPDAIGIDAIFSPEGENVLKLAYGAFPALERAFRDYLRVGGYPAAVEDYLGAHGQVRSETLRLLWDVVAGDIASIRYDRAAALKLLEEVSVCLGAPLAWSHASRAMGLRDSDAARIYTERLAENFVLLPIYLWEEGGAFQPRKQRKVFFVDPVFAAVPASVAPGARRPPEDGLVENLVAIGLYRSAATSLVQAAPEPGAIGYWRSSNGRETDFVVPSRKWKRVAIEVKGDSRSAIANARSAIQRGPWRGLVASRSKFDLGADVPVVPVAVLLSVLRERPRRETLAEIQPEGISAGITIVGGSLERVDEDQR